MTCLVLYDLFTVPCSKVLPPSVVVSVSAVYFLSSDKENVP